MTRDFGEVDPSLRSTTSASTADGAHENLLSEAYSHVKNTWKDVLHGDASGAQYLEAAGEAVGVAALTYGAIRGGPKLFSFLKGGSETELALGKNLAPDLTMGKTAISELIPNLGEKQLQKLAFDMKLFPAAGKVVDPVEAERAIGAIARYAPELSSGEAVGTLRSVEGGYQSLGQHEKAIEIINRAIADSKGLPNRLSFGILPQSQRIKPLFYLDKSESLAALGKTEKATTELNKFASSWGAENLAGKFPGLPVSDASNLVKEVLPKFELPSVANNQIFHDIERTVAKIDVPKDLIKPFKQPTFSELWSQS